MHLLQLPLRIQFLRLVRLILFLPFLLSSASCERTKATQERTKEWIRSDSDKLKVLVTTAHVGSLVKAVGADAVSVLELIQGESDPHSYQLVKGDDEKFARADVIFYSGLGLEHSPSIAAQLGRFEAVSIGDSIAKKDLSSVIHLGGAIDPHMWMDVSLWAKGCFVIANKLSLIDPEKREFFESNARKHYEKLMQLDEKIIALLQSLPSEKRYLVTTHDAFNYFTRRYLSSESERDGNQWRSRCRAPEGLAPDSQISTQDILEISDYILRNKVTVLFAEHGINQDSLMKLQEVVREKGGMISIVTAKLYSDSMGEEGTEEGTYEGMIWHNAKTIYEAISL